MAWSTVSTVMELVSVDLFPGNEKTLPWNSLSSHHFPDAALYSRFEKLVTCPSGLRCAASEQFRTFSFEQTKGVVTTTGCSARRGRSLAVPPQAASSGTSTIALRATSVTEWPCHSNIPGV